MKEVASLGTSCDTSAKNNREEICEDISSKIKNEENYGSII